MSKNKKKKDTKKHETSSKSLEVEKKEVDSEKTESRIHKKSSHSVVHGLVSIGVTSVLLTFLALNIWASQLIDPLYSRLVKEEPEAEYEFFSAVRKLPVFTQIYPSLSGTFEQYRTRLEVQDSARKEQIAELESYLEQNPKSRDIFLVIAFLYEQEGNFAEAAEYYDQARAIDPSLPEPAFSFTPLAQ